MKGANMSYDSNKIFIKVKQALKEEIEGKNALYAALRNNEIEAEALAITCDVLSIALDEKDELGEHGLNYRKKQSKTAKKSRSPKNETGQTLQDVLVQLARNNPDCKPSEIWQHFKSAIEDWGGIECKEIKPGIVKDNWFYEYEDTNERIRTITYGQFRKTLAKIIKTTK